MYSIISSIFFLVFIGSASSFHVSTKTTTSFSSFFGTTRKTLPIISASSKSNNDGGDREGMNPIQKLKEEAAKLRQEVADFEQGKKDVELSEQRAKQQVLEKKREVGFWLLLFVIFFLN